MTKHDMKADTEFPALAIRYEGNDAERHELDLNQLGQSLQGFARIFAVSANVLKTGKLNKHFDSLDVRVVSVPVTDHRCYEVLAVIRGLAESKELWSGVFGAILAAVVQYVLSRRDRDEMRYLSEALKQSLQNNQGTVDKLVDTIEKMADALRPAARQALTPIERSCKRIDLYADGSKFHELDAATKRSFEDMNAVISDHSTVYTGVITEFDMANGACKVTLDGETSRLPAIVTDPIFNRPNNPYVEALAASRPLRFVAKAELDQDGNPVKLYISDTAENSL
ncbi:DUF7946 domain-containing protein [Burkholderia sp. BC1]|uniref:DUF7946 domain-containing protein n=1 Tax=Burkholderia sp. BC1 TaxID=1095370 RepID=UPI004043FE2D